MRLWAAIWPGVKGLPFLSAVASGVASGLSSGSAGATITGLTFAAGFVATAGVAGAATPATTHLAATNCFQVIPSGIVLAVFIAFQAAEQSFMKLPEAVVAGVAAVAAVVALAAGAAAAVAGTTHLPATNCFQVMPAGTVLAAFMPFQAVEQSFMKLPDALAVVAAAAGTTGTVVAFALAAAGAGAAAASAGAASAAH